MRMGGGGAARLLTRKGTAVTDTLARDGLRTRVTTGVAGASHCVCRGVCDCDAGRVRYETFGRELNIDAAPEGGPASAIANELKLGELKSNAPWMEWMRWVGAATRAIGVWQTMRVA